MAAVIVEEIARIVEDACARESNVFGYGIWTHHITQVAKNGIRLAHMFGADPEIVEIAALLHDYASVKDHALYEEHHIHGPLEAEKILRKLRYPQVKIEAVKQCIAAHRASVPGAKRSAEATCLANADGMTHLAQIPSLLYLAYVRKEMGIDAGSKWVRQKIERSWNKLTPRVRELMLPKYEAALKTLTVLESLE